MTGKQLPNSPDFRALFESAPGLFLVLSPELKIIAVSNAYLQATKTVRESIIGLGIFDVFPDNPDDPDATGVRNLTASLNRVLKNKIPDAMAVQKYDIPRPEKEDGGFEERYWSPLNSPVLNNNNEVIYIIHRVEDVTQFIRLKQQGTDQGKPVQELRTQSEENETEIFVRAQQLQEANKRLREAENTKEEANKFLKSILENIPDMIFVKDAEELRFVQFNKAGEELLGYSRDELIGKNDYDFFPKAEADFFTLKDKEVLKQKKMLDIPEESINTRLKGVRWLHTKKIPIYDENGNPKFLLGISDDITERKKDEEKIVGLNKELARAKNELEWKVLERTAELQDANEDLKNLLEKLERSNKRLEEFAYVSSHNLRAPLANLISLVSMYGQQHNGDMVFDKIQFTANQLNGIVNELTELVALDKPAGDKREIQFADLFESVRTSVESQIRASGAAISTDFSSVPSITYFHSHLQSILLNLLTNAVKYCSPERKPQITIKTERIDGFINLSVSDNGIGIDLEKNRNKIFAAFKRLSQNVDGKGLGLYIVQRQVEQFGGKIDVRSKIGAGSEFIVSLKNNPAT